MAEYTRINISLPENLKDVWKAFADEMNTNVSNMIRNAVREYMMKNKKEEHKNEYEKEEKIKELNNKIEKMSSIMDKIAETKEKKENVKDILEIKESILQALEMKEFNFSNLSKLIRGDEDSIMKALSELRSDKIVERGEEGWKLR